MRKFNHLIISVVCFIGSVIFAIAEGNDELIARFATIFTSDVDAIETVKLWVGGTLKAGTILPLGIHALRRERRYVKHEAVINNYCASFLKRLNVLLQNKDLLRNYSGRINVRFFVVKGKYLKHVDYPTLRSDSVADNLQFNIEADEGLVTQCYKSGDVQMELYNCCDAKYNLSPYNRSAVRDLRFIVGVPIILADEKLKCIVTFDSYDKIVVKDGKENELPEFFSALAYEIHNILM